MAILRQKGDTDIYFVRGHEYLADLKPFPNNKDCIRSTQEMERYKIHLDAPFMLTRDRQNLKDHYKKLDKMKT